MDFSSAAGIDYAHVSVASHLGLLQTLLLVEKCSKIIATQDVALLFESDATGKGELHRDLFERAMSCLDRYRARARRSFGRCAGSDRQLDIFLQLESFGLLFD